MEELKNVFSRDILVQTEDVRVVEMTLEPGETIPWHYHTHVADTFFCLEGELEIEFENPTGGALLLAGDRAPVEARRPHQVVCSGESSCRFLLVQGVGRYDYVPVEHGETQA
jgi:quercetin dioxygenase-like cupin family protein